MLNTRDWNWIFPYRFTVNPDDYVHGLYFVVICCDLVRVGGWFTGIRQSYACLSVSATKTIEV